ncbi:MAG: hypothetical protein KAU50_08765 [Candidatus Marinimicrobia bacterium]|nr:hypothetical protein [Candidatus Neomarinimicrobiota bacterium]
MPLLIGGFFLTTSARGEQTTWLAIGNLHSWFSNAGIEREIGRTGLQADQQDGLRWPAQYKWQDTQAAKAMWLGAKNYYDDNVDKTFAVKVVHVGPRILDDTREIMPKDFKLYGRFPHTNVYVDKTPGSEMMYGMDEVTEPPDEDLIADRMIYNTGNTALGVSYIRRVYAFSNQYHDNYFISEYEFINTGIINSAGDVETQTLEDFVVFYQYRYSPTREAGVYGINVTPQSASWGHNAVNDMFFTHPVTGDPFRMQFTWMGKHSQETNYDIIGAPAWDTDGHLAASQYVGVITLHADTSPSNPTDDLGQPSTTMYLQSDVPITSNNSQFNDKQMAAEYLAMTAGHPTLRQADDAGCPNPVECEGFLDTYERIGEGNPGGYSHGQGFGPYTLEPGDTIRIVVAEGVAGISREMVYQVGAKWLAGGGGPLPSKVGGGTTDDKNYYKNAWVWTGEDSLVQTFERAVANFQADLIVPEPPRPPSLFEVNSGGDQIALNWEYDGGIPDNVAGFKVYRTIDKPDTSYTEVFACGAGTANPEIVTEFIDTSPVRGFDYYYYVVAFDDGSTNDIQPGVPLVSSKFWTMTNEPASLKRAPSSPLEGIRIVPNPYNIRAYRLQFAGSGPNRIMFYNTPAYCTIRIYTERGDLIQTVEHDDASGDEAWDLVTSSNQLVVSGLYIAHIEASRDWPDPKTGIMIKKGESIIKKFIVVR